MSAACFRLYGVPAVPGILLITAGLSLPGCSEPRAARFSVENARAHVGMLAGTIGARPTGSAANARARGYLIDQLRLYGYDVRVQETDAVRAELGTTARVANVIAIKAGARPEAIGLVAHYDSVAQAPGALDDGLGVAVALEAGRVLAAQPSRQHSVMVILTDGEEIGLMGATAVVTDPDVSSRLRAYLNLESIGASGPSVLFEAGPRPLPLLQAWTRAPHPHGASYATEIYLRLPNDTDFTIFRRHDIPGLNFAAIGDSYAYHTSRDTPDRLQSATIRHMGETVVATATAIDQLDAAATGDGASGDPGTGPGGSAIPRGRATSGDALAAHGTDGGATRFFDLGRERAVAYSSFVGRALTIAAVVIGLVAWWRVLRQTAAHGIGKVIVSLLWGLLAIAAAVGALLGASWLLRASREVYHPWYAHPMRLLALLIAAGVAGGWHLTRLMHLLPPGGQPLRTPAAVWALTLPIWTGLAGTMEYLAPAASNLWSVPLLAAGVLLAIAPLRTTALLRLASLIVAAVCALLWLQDSVDLFAFLNATLGRLPIITPFWLFPAYVVVVCLVLAPPIVAALTGLVRGPILHGVISAALLVLLAFTMGFAYTADAYTPERPLHRIARYVSDGPQGKGWWEVASNEPGLDLNLPSAEAVRWRPQERGARLPASVPVAALVQPFMFRTESQPTDAPVDITASITPAVTTPPAPGSPAPAATTTPPATAPLPGTSPAAAPAATAPAPGSPVSAPPTAPAAATPLAGTPAGATAPAPGTVDLEITIAPREESLSATIALPTGVEPLQANLAGRRRAGDRWRATFAAIPATGIAFRATLPTAVASRLADTLVIVTAARGPKPEEPRVPAFLPQARADWTVSSQWIVRPPFGVPAIPPTAPPDPPALPPAVPGAVPPTVGPPTAGPPATAPR